MVGLEGPNSLLDRCDSKFYPYIIKVLQRLPAYVYKDEIQNDKTFEIISFDSRNWDGCYRFFNTPIKDLIILNDRLLQEPEFQIIHTIAHELAHKVAGVGETGLNEMEAEHLLVNWGFGAESKAVNYYRPILETDGFEIGYEWAQSADIREFEQFYDEWNAGYLTLERFEELLSVVDPESILSGMGYLEEVSDVKKEDLPEDAIIDNEGILNKGIVFGIMCFLREMKNRE